MATRFLRPRSRETELGTAVWRSPLRFSLRVLVLAAITLTLDHQLQGRLDSVPRMLRMSGDDSTTILATLSGATITVVGLVVSLTMVVLSLVADNFGPRLVVNFIRRRTTQTVIGSFIAVFVYSIVTLSTTLRADDASFVPLVSTWTAIILVLVATAHLVRFVHDTSSSIQVGNTLVDIAAELSQAIQAQRDLAAKAASTTPYPIETAGWFEIPSLVSGYVQCIEYRALADLAAAEGGVIALTTRAGSFVHAGRPVALCSVPLGERSTAAVQRAVVAGARRTMEQDLEYAFAEYVEIALRALSPAINDPTTAMSCLDWIGDGLLSLVSEPVDVATFADASGVVRVVAPCNTPRRVVAAGFNEIRQAAVGMPAVQI
ncbi:MAG: DUF2254 domain-containing protein, partial [Ilumatobacteraceae bacterium]